MVAHTYNASTQEVEVEYRRSGHLQLHPELEATVKTQNKMIIYKLGRETQKKATL